MVTKFYVDIKCPGCKKVHRLREYEGLEGAWYGGHFCDKNPNPKPYSPRYLEQRKKKATKKNF